MKKKLVVESHYDKYLNLDVRIFCKSKSKPEPITGRLLVVKKKFIVILAKKAIRQDRRIVYKKRSVKKENIESIRLI